MYDSPWTRNTDTPAKLYPISVGKSTDAEGKPSPSYLIEGCDGHGKVKHRRTAHDEQRAMSEARMVAAYKAVRVVNVYETEDGINTWVAEVVES